MKNKTLTISNSSYGIKNPSKIFDRFYKESERGLGIGLHIVDKLCRELGIRKKLDVKNNMVIISLLLKGLSLEKDQINYYLYMYYLD